MRLTNHPASTLSAIRRRRRGYKWLAFFVFFVIVLVSGTAGGVDVINKAYQHNNLRLQLDLLITGLRIAMAVITPLVVYGLLNIRRRVIHISFIAFLSIYYSLEIFLVYYVLRRSVPFDFFYFWLNKDDAYATVATVYSYLPLRLAVLLLIFFAFCVLLYRWQKSVASIRKFTSLWFRSLIVCVLVVNAMYVSTPLKRAFFSARTTFNILQNNKYLSYYEKSIHSQSPTIPATLSTDNSIVFLHLESVNSDLVSPTSTPELYRLAARGILIKNHFSDGVQTHRAEETILCGALPSLNISYTDGTYKNIVDAARERGIALHCLPDILKQAGYVTIFIKSHVLEFERAGEFAAGIGFDEVLDARSILQEGDPVTSWGGREDVYYSRVVDYLKRSHEGKKLFVYIAVSSTNHVPFRRTPDNTRSDVYARLPYIPERSYEDRRSNSLYAQDAYLADFIDAYGQAFSFKSTDLFIYGDHPVAIWDQNPYYSYNSEGIDDKAFLTTMAFIPASNHAKNFYPPRIIDSAPQTSHSGVAPTLLDMLGIPNPYFLKSSWYPLLAGEKQPPLCNVNVQPYTSVAISLVEHPYKVIIDLFNGRVHFIEYTGDGEQTRRVDQSLEKADIFLEACINNSLDQAVVSYISSGNSPQ